VVTVTVTVVAFQKQLLGLAATADVSNKVDMMGFGDNMFFLNRKVDRTMEEKFEED